MYATAEICDDIELGEYPISNKWPIKLPSLMDFTGNDMESAQEKKSFHECWYAFLVAGANEACSSLCAEDVECKEGPLEFSLVVVVNMMFPEMLPEVCWSRALTKFAMFVVESAVSWILSDEDVGVPGFGMTLLD